MNKLIKLIFSISILFFVLAIPRLIITINTDGIVIGILNGCMYLVAGSVCFKLIYTEFLFANRNSKWWCSSLNDEEKEIVEEAKETIKKVDENIVISKFNVYKIRFWKRGWFRYDKIDKSLNIFIPFKYFYRLGGNNLVFLSVLHEILHSQNLKNNIIVFNKDFMEGLNQLLTNWLIENYSSNFVNVKFHVIQIKKQDYFHLVYKNT